MPNPWLILGAAALWAASVWYAYDSGGTNRENEMRAAYATQLEAKITEHNEATTRNMQAVQRWAETRGVARGRSDATASAVEADIHDHPLPACKLTADSVGLLNNAVHDANDLRPSADRVPGAVPDAAGTGGRGRLNPPPVGSLGIKPSGGMPASARRVR